MGALYRYAAKWQPLFEPEGAVAYLLNKGGGLERDLRRELGCGFEGGYRFRGVSHRIVCGGEDEISLRISRMNFHKGFPYDGNFVEAFQLKVRARDARVRRLARRNDGCEQLGGGGVAPSRYRGCRIEDACLHITRLQFIGGLEISHHARDIPAHLRVARHFVQNGLFGRRKCMRVRERLGTRRIIPERIVQEPEEERGPRVERRRGLLQFHLCNREIIKLLFELRVDTGCRSHPRRNLHELFARLLLAERALRHRLLDVVEILRNAIRIRTDGLDEEPVLCESRAVYPCGRAPEHECREDGYDRQTLFGQRNAPEPRRCRTFAPPPNDVGNDEAEEHVARYIVE